MSDVAKQLLLEAQAECDHAVSDIQHNMWEHADDSLRNALKLGKEAREHIDDNHRIALNYLDDAESDVNIALKYINSGAPVTAQAEHARDAAINYGGAYYSL